MEERAAYRATGGVPPALETKEVEEQRHAAGEARHDNTDADFREGGPMLVHSNVLALLAAVLVITHTPARVVAFAMTAAELRHVSASAHRPQRRWELHVAPAFHDLWQEALADALISAAIPSMYLHRHWQSRRGLARFGGQEPEVGVKLPKHALAVHAVERGGDGTCVD